VEPIPYIIKAAIAARFFPRGPAFSPGEKQQLPFNPGIGWTYPAKQDPDGLVFNGVFNFGRRIHPSSGKKIGPNQIPGPLKTLLILLPL
jgi:hypothetical protein